jgi:hypothetical protein
MKGANATDQEWANIANDATFDMVSCTYGVQLYDVSGTLNQYDLSLSFGFQFVKQQDNFVLSEF